MRRGEVAFDEWWHRVLELDARLEEREHDEDVPPGPDRARIEAWTIAAHLRTWSTLQHPRTR